MATAVEIKVLISDDGTTAVLDNQATKIQALGTAAATTGDQLQKMSTGLDGGNIKRASGEMEQMVANIEAATQKYTQLENKMHGPQTRDSYLGSLWGTKQFEQEAAKLRESDAVKKLQNGSWFPTKPTEDALDGLGGHVSSNLDKVRLLSQEFGLRLPRALESMIARMPGVMNAIGGLTAGIAGIAIAEVFYRGGQAIYDAEQKYISITASADKFYETLKKTSELDFTNTRDLATTQARLDQANERMSGGPAEAKSLQRMGLGNLLSNPSLGLGLLLSAKGVADDASSASAQGIDLDKRKLDQQHEQALAQIELNHALDGTLSKQQQIAAADQKAHQVSQENRTYSVRSESQYANRTPGDAGATEQQMANAQADAEQRMKLSDLQLQQVAALTKARSQASEAGLQGEALYAQKLRDSIAELHADLAAQRDLSTFEARRHALLQQYEADRAARLRTLTEETQRMTADANKAGLTGAARILADRDESLQKVDQRQKDVSGGAALSPEQLKQFADQRVAITRQANAQITELMGTFSDTVTATADRALANQLGGFERINAEAKRAHDELQKTFDKDFGDAAMTPEQASAQTDQKRRGDDAIDAEAQQRRTQLAQQNAAEDLQFAREAAQAESRVRGNGLTSWISDYRNAVAAIHDQEAQRMLKLDQDATKEGLTWQEVAQRRADIESTAMAGIAEQNQQLQHTIAGNLQSAFTDPMRFIKEQGEKMMFEMIAKWLMQLNLFKNAYGALMGGLGPAGSTGGSTGVQGAAGGVTAGVGGLTKVFSHQRPSGTAGVISGGTMLPNGYSSSSLDSGSGGGYSSTIASPGSSAYGGTSSTITGRVGGAAAAASRAGGGSIVGQAGATVSDARSLMIQFGLTGKQTAAAADTTPQWNDPTDPEAQASADSDAALSRTAGGPTAASAASKALGLAGAGFTAYQGTEGVIDSFHEGGVKGALSGTMDGAAAGAAIGSIIPGIGTVVGGVVGAAAGLATNLIGDAMGESGKFAARDYYKNTMFPELEGLRNSNGGSDYLSEVSEANRDAAEGMAYMSKKWGQGAADWVNDNYLKKELNDITTMIERRAGGNAQFIGQSAKQFHQGGLISGFGGLATSANEGYIHTEIGEGVVNQPAMARHGAAVGMLNSGASPADMAAHFLAASGSGGRVGVGGDTHHHHWDVDALDAKSFEDFLDGGGNVAVSRSTNRLTAAYGGDGQP